MSNYSWVKNTLALSTEETCKLVDQLRECDSKSVRDKIIMGNARLVLFKVNAYIGFYRQTLHLKDDMESAGFLGLIKAVNYLADTTLSHTESPSGLMSLFIHREIGRLIENSNLIPTPQRTKQRHNLKDIRVDGFVESDYDLPKSDSVDGLRATIFGLTDNEYERRIIDLREHGFNDSDISEKMDLPTSTINLIRRELFNKFKGISR